MRWVWACTAAAAALCGLSPARADTWTPIGSAGGVAAAYDASDITAGGGRMFATIRFEYSSNQTDAGTKQSFRYAFWRFAIDCTAKTLAATQETLEDASGRQLRHEEIGLQAAQFGPAASPLEKTFIPIVCASPATVGLTPGLPVGPTSHVQWQLVYQSTPGRSYYVDAADLADLAVDGTKRFFIRTVSDPPEDIGDGFYAATSYAEVLMNCGAGTFTMGALDEYDPDGRFITSTRDDAQHPEVRDVKPGTYFAGVHDAACGLPSSEAPDQRAPGQPPADQTQPDVVSGTALLGRTGYLITAPHVVDGALGIALAQNGHGVGGADVVATTNDIARPRF